MLNENKNHKYSHFFLSVSHPWDPMENKEIIEPELIKYHVN